MLDLPWSWIQSIQHSREDTAPALCGALRPWSSGQAGKGGRAEGGDLHRQELACHKMSLPGQKQGYKEYRLMKRVLHHSMDGNFGKSIVGGESESLSGARLFRRTDRPTSPTTVTLSTHCQGQLVALRAGTT